MLERRKSQLFFLADACGVALHVIRDIIPVSGREITEKILCAASPLLISAGQDLRLCICDLLHGLSVTDPSIILVVYTPFLLYY